MRKEIIYCDICGEEIGGKDYVSAKVKIGLLKNVDGYVCSDCYSEIRYNVRKRLGKAGANIPPPTIRPKPPKMYL